VTTTAVTVRLGDARCPGPSTADILRADTPPPPAPLLEQAPAYLGSDDIPYSDYTDPGYMQAEFDHMWSRTWQWACREEHIPESGDYYVYDIGDQSAIVVRGDDGEVRGFHNVCLHRGTQLKPAATAGFATQLRCPFHGWTWGLDGALSEIPCEWDFGHVDTDRCNLRPVRTAKWGGFVWVNFDTDGAPLQEYIAPLIDHFQRAGWDLAQRYVEVHVRKRLPANWKAAAAAFLEAYHILETHSQSIYTAGDANAQYDVFGEHVTRFIHTTATPSPHLPEADRPSEQRMIDMLAARKGGGTPPTLGDGERARDVYAAMARDMLSAAYDFDASGYSTSETIDSIEYFAFPNAFFFPGLQIPMVYRFRPDGTARDQGLERTIFEVLFLRPLPRSGDAPSPAEPVDLGVDDSYTTVAKIPGSLGVVFDQDTSNLAAQTRGFRSAAKAGQTLGNYQEVRTRHLHQTVRRFIDDGRRQTS
jgi:phenylpropionate dioxygenase-like ring-hydroxylating dioxygenase large terminal subunit